MIPIEPRDDRPPPRLLRRSGAVARGSLRLPQAGAASHDSGPGVLHELFEARADDRPEATAVVSGRTAMSYLDLDRYANRLARHLLALGVRRGSRVGILLRRSADAYAAILGTLKAGAACVPLDPRDPARWRSHTLEDSGASALLTTSEFAPRRPVFGGAVVRLDSSRRTIAAENPARLPRHRAVRSGDLCYVMYAPDGVHRPKGVMIEHGSLCHLVRTAGRAFGVRPWDRVYQGSPLSGDGALPEIWLAFHAGATLIAPAGMETGAGDLARRLASARITVLSCAPSLLATLAGDVPSLRLLILRGEPCPDHLVERWTRADRRLVRTYGHAETAGLATYAELLPGEPVTLGRPLPGCRVYVVDDQLRLARWGSIGEICVGGVGIARGYLGLPADTHGRFVKDPFAPKGAGDARIYRTADLGRIDPSGNLELHGSTRRLRAVPWSREGSRS